MEEPKRKSSFSDFINLLSYSTLNGRPYVGIPSLASESAVSFALGRSHVRTQGLSYATSMIDHYEINGFFAARSSKLVYVMQNITDRCVLE